MKMNSGLDGSGRRCHATSPENHGRPGGRVPAQRGRRGRPEAAGAASAQTQQEPDRLLLEVREAQRILC